MGGDMGVEEELQLQLAAEPSRPAAAAAASPVLTPHAVPPPPPPPPEGDALASAEAYDSGVWEVDEELVPPQAEDEMPTSLALPAGMYMLCKFASMLCSHVRAALPDDDIVGHSCHWGSTQPHQRPSAQGTLLL
jgi:hypothetical protein